MFETFTVLLAAHLLSDFPLQTDWLLNKKKTTIWGVFVHVLIVALATIVLIGNWHPASILAIVLTHLAIDAIKLKWFEKGIYPFVFDQLLHWGVLLVVAWITPTLFKDGLWMNSANWWIPATWQIENKGFEKWFMAAMTLTSGVILCIPAGGILIGKATNLLFDDEDNDDGEGNSPPANTPADQTASQVPVAESEEEVEEQPQAVETGAAPKNTADEEDDQLTDAEEESIKKLLRGLPNGGRYIGYLERALILLLVLYGQAAGIGFLIAAKSILRFGDIQGKGKGEEKGREERAASEYVIIGTFLSFTWAILIAGLTLQAIEFWIPPTPPTP